MKKPLLISQIVCFMMLSVSLHAKEQFLGIFTHTKTVSDLETKHVLLVEALDANPHLSGVTIKVWWKHLHPAPGVVHWDKLEAIVDLASSRGLKVNLSLWGGYYSPEWIYEHGVQRVPGDHWYHNAPVPWDPIFERLFISDLEELARRYADDPRIFMVGVAGHNFRGEEMHTPPVYHVPGWSREKVLDCWEGWIRTFDRLFPEKRLFVVVSQMYPGQDGLTEEVVDYFVETVGSRGVLQTHQLAGRSDNLPESGRLCHKHHSVVPHTHELLGSLTAAPERQGSLDMTMYNLVRMGNPLFLQIWQRDSLDPQHALRVLQKWEKYGHLDPETIQRKLIDNDLFQTKDMYRRPTREHAIPERSEELLRSYEWLQGLKLENSRNPPLLGFLIRNELWGLNMETTASQLQSETQIAGSTLVLPSPENFGEDMRIRLERAVETHELLGKIVVLALPFTWWEPTAEPMREAFAKWVESQPAVLGVSDTDSFTEGRYFAGRPVLRTARMAPTALDSFRPGPARMVSLSDGIQSLDSLVTVFAELGGTGVFAIELPPLK